MEAVAERKLLGVRAAGRELGLNASTVSRNIRDGIITNHGTATEPLIDIEEARQQRSENLDRSKIRGAGALAPSLALQPGPQAPAEEGAASSSATSYQNSRARREDAQAQLAEIELQEKLGEVVYRAEVSDAFFALAQALKQMMELRRPLVATRIAGLTDTGAIMAILADEDAKLQQRVVDEFTRSDFGAAVAATEDEAA